MKNYIFILAASILLFGCQEDEREPARKISETGGGKMRITSSAFENGERIPVKYTADGQDISPPLAIEGVPGEARSLVLIVDDPDAPVGTWDHWIVFNIPADIKEIAENVEPEGISGRNSWGRLGYGGPAPPSGTHRYFFKLYALDNKLDLKKGAGKKEIQKAMNGHILEESQVMGKYSR